MDEKHDDGAQKECGERIPGKKTGLSHLFAATSYSFQGLKAAFCGEAAFRHDLLLVAFQTILAFVLPLGLVNRMVLVCLGLVLLTTELLNSGLEAIVDLVSPQWHPLAKRAKDMGSAAVFCMLMAIGVAWAMTLAGLLLPVAE